MSYDRYGNWTGPEQKEDRIISDLIRAQYPQTHSGPHPADDMQSVTSDWTDRSTRSRQSPQSPAARDDFPASEYGYGRERSFDAYDKPPRRGQPTDQATFRRPSVPSNRDPSIRPDDHYPGTQGMYGQSRRIDFRPLSGPPSREPAPLNAVSAQSHGDLGVFGESACDRDHEARQSWEPFWQAGVKSHRVEPNDYIRARGQFLRSAAQARAAGYSPPSLESGYEHPRQPRLTNTSQEIPVERRLPPPPPESVFSGRTRSSGPSQYPQRHIEPRYRYDD